MRRWLVGIAVGAVLGACGPDSKTHDGNDSTGGVAGSMVTGGSGATSGAGSGGTAAGGAGSGGTAAVGGSGACNQLEANAPAHPFLFDAGPPPVALGGTIVDGTYFVTSETLYGAPPTPAVTVDGVRIETAGSTWLEADTLAPEDTGTPLRYTYAISVEGPRVTMTLTCPISGDPVSGSYTVEQTGFTVFVPSGDFTMGIKMARQ